MARFKGLSSISTDKDTPPLPPSSQAAAKPGPPPAVDAGKYSLVLRDCVERLNAALKGFPALQAYMKTAGTGFHGVARKSENKALHEKADMSETLQHRVDDLCLKGAPVNQVEQVVSLWEAVQVELLTGLNAAIQAPQGGLF